MEYKCNSCLEMKPADEFPRHRKGGAREGRHYKCKPCYAAYFAEYRKEKPEMFQKNKRNAVVRRKGIEPEVYDAMFAAQGGVCAACGRESEPTKSLRIDHDHACCPGEKACGKCVRGLLCMGCNAALGIIEDEERVAMLKRYLEWSQCKGSLIDPTKGWT